MPQTKRTKGHTDTQRLNWLLKNNTINVHDTWLDKYLFTRRDIDKGIRDSKCRRVPK